MLIGTPLFISLIVGLSVLAIVAGLTAMLGAESDEERVQELLSTASSTPPTLRQLEMQESFYQRAIRPLGRIVVQWLGRLAPQRNVTALEGKLDSAGRPGNLSTIDFLGIKIGLALVLGALMILILYLSPRDLSPILVIVLGLVFGLIGFGLPNYWLSARISARQAQILRALPDAMDMMNICVRAGLGLSGAMQRICEHWDNPLVEEFARVLAETRLGRSRTDALESMAKRTGVDEMISFVMALTMAEKMGANIAQVLNIQAKQMRVARRQRAEKLAREASIKMLFPLVFLIFPAMFAVILGPTVPLLLETFK